jgi:hypothetical protein
MFDLEDADAHAASFQQHATVAEPDSASSPQPPPSALPPVSESVLAATSTQRPNIDSHRFAQQIGLYFSFDELKNITQDIGLNYKDVETLTRSQMAEWLVLQAAATDLVDRLLQMCRVKRPDLDWSIDQPALKQEPGTREEALKQLAELASMIARHFSIEEIANLADDLGLNHDDLPNARRRMAAELVDICHRHQKLPMLFAQCQLLRPKEDWPKISSTDRQAPRLTIEKPLAVTAAMRDLIARRFDIAEIRMLSHDLGIEEAWNLDRVSMAREVVLYMARRDRLDELLAYCSKERPDVIWPPVDSVRSSIDIDPELRPLQSRAGQLRDLIAKNFNSDEIKTLMDYLGIDYEEFGILGRTAYARELVSHLGDAGRLENLSEICRQKRPKVSWP